MNIVSYGPCFICRRDCDETSVNVDFGRDGIHPLCWRCYDKAYDERWPKAGYLEERLDMTDDD